MYYWKFTTQVKEPFLQRVANELFEELTQKQFLWDTAGKHFGFDMEEEHIVVGMQYKLEVH